MDHEVREDELLRASAAGSREAFGVVVQRYQSLVCAITYSATGDIGASEELAQETFIRAWRNLRQLEDLGKFRAWLCTIARNLANTSLRARRKDAAHPLEMAVEQPAAGPGPDEAALAKERQEIIWAAVERVPLQYREPLVLFYRRQRSVNEVAADLGLSEAAVRQRLHRGRQLIKAEVSSLVEDTLVRSGPGKTFAIAVIAALPALITPPASAAVAGVAVKGAPAAKTLLTAGVVGAILGPILGLLGGVFGSWCSIRNTHSPRERRFMVRMTVLLWTLLTALIGVPLALALAGLIPKWVYWSCWGVFFVGLLPLIVWANRRQRCIQMEDGTYRQPEDVVSLSTSGIYGSFAGSIFGATLWMLILAGLVGDWRTFVLIVCCDVSIFCGATVFCVRHPRHYWFAAILAVLGVMAMTLVAVNLCWAAWMAAYRLSSAYDARNDVSLSTLNLVLLGLYGTVILTVLMARRRARNKKSK